MEEAHRVGERILDEHALGVAGNEILGGRACVIGEQDGGLIVTEVGDEELAVGALKRPRLVFMEAWIAVFAMGHVEFDGAPSRCWQVGDLGEQLGRGAVPVWLYTRQQNGSLYDGDGLEMMDEVRD